MAKNYRKILRTMAIVFAFALCGKINASSIEIKPALLSIDGLTKTTQLVSATALPLFTGGKKDGRWGRGSNDDNSNDRGGRWGRGSNDDHSSDKGGRWGRGSNDDDSSGKSGRWGRGSHGDDDSSSGRGWKCDPDRIPLDGGLGFLLLGATAFGIRKLRDKKK